MLRSFLRTVSDTLRTFLYLRSFSRCIAEAYLAYCRFEYDSIRHFYYRLTACRPNATRSIAVAILSVCPSVCQIRVLWQHETIVCQYLNTIWNRDISSLSTPTATGVAGNCPLPPEIFAESDPSGLKCTAVNCTVNLSDVGTTHSSRTVSLR